MATDIRLRGSSRRGGGLLKTLFLVFAAAAVIALAVAGVLLFEFEKPTLVLGKEIRFLGGKVDLPLRAADGKSGLRSLVITLSQAEKTAMLLEKTFPRQAWFSMAGPASISEKVMIDAQKAGIKEGSAELTVTVRDFSLFGWLQGNRTEIRLPVTMDTKPPRVALVQAQRHIRPGGSGIAVYTVSETPGRHGVQIDNAFFPVSPAPGRTPLSPISPCPGMRNSRQPSVWSRPTRQATRLRCPWSLPFKRRTRNMTASP